MSHNEVSASSRKEAEASAGGMGGHSRREAIWSVPAGWDKAYFRTFYVLVAISGVVAGANDIVSHPHAVPLERIHAVGTAFSSLVIGSVVSALAFTEVVMTLSEAFLARRERRGREKERLSWQGWVLRKHLADQVGYTFNEDPPSPILKVEVYVNNSPFGSTMRMDELVEKMERWKSEGREVEVHGLDDTKPGSELGVPRVRVIRGPLPAFATTYSKPKSGSG